MLRWLKARGLKFFLRSLSSFTYLGHEGGLSFLKPKSKHTQNYEGVLLISCQPCNDWDGAHPSPLLF